MEPDPAPSVAFVPAPTIWHNGSGHLHHFRKCKQRRLRLMNVAFCDVYGTSA
jgi:hypothetical protein